MEAIPPSSLLTVFTPFFQPPLSDSPPFQLFDEYIETDAPVPSLDPPSAQFSAARAKRRLAKLTPPISSLMLFCPVHGWLYFISLV